MCIGAPDMFTAFQRFETLNYSAELEILAGRIGTVKSLDKDAQRLTATNDHTKLDDFIPRVYSSEELSARRDMITLIKRSYRMGLFTATHGTYSVRLADDSFLITPFGQDRAYLTEDDLVRVKAGMKELGKTPSRAVQLHSEITLDRVLFCRRIPYMPWPLPSRTLHLTRVPSPRVISCCGILKNCPIRRFT